MSDQTQDTRVPVPTLWATMAAEWLQCASDPVVMLGSGVVGSSESAMRRQGVASGKAAGVTRRVSSGAEDGPCGRSNTSIGR